LKTFPSHAEAVYFVWRPFSCGRVVEAALSNELGRRKSASSVSDSISLTRRDSFSSSYSSMCRRSNASRANVPVNGSSPRTPPIMRCTSREALSALKPSGLVIILIGHVVSMSTFGLSGKGVRKRVYIIKFRRGRRLISHQYYGLIKLYFAVFEPFGSQFQDLPTFHC